MFFPRLRRQAKWVFVFLAVVFAAGFVFFGVGSGSGIGDLLAGNFNIFGSGGTSTSSGVADARKRVKAHPNDPAAWTALATAYSTEGKLGKANDAFEHVLKLRPNDVDALQRVAEYYENRYFEKYEEAQRFASQAPTTVAGVLGTRGPLAQLMGQDQLTLKATEKAQASLVKASEALQKDEQLYKRLARLQPDDVNTQFRFAQLADAVGDTKAAIAAYQKVVKLAPTDPSAAQAKERIAALRRG